VTRHFWTLLSLCTLSASTALAQAPVTLTVDTSSKQFAIPADYSGLGFETKSVVPDTYGVKGYFFTPTNSQLITLFQNIGLKNIRVGGGTVDGSGTNEQCVTPTPDPKAIDNLFAFAQASGVKVIYSVRLLNLDQCKDPDLAAKDAQIASYIWSHYRAQLDSFSIGNEPDVREFHDYPDHPHDSSIRETIPGIPGSAYPGYFTQWRRIANAILKAVPEAKFSGPDTAVSDQSSFTPNPSFGVSWTQQFATDLKSTGILKTGLQHHYVWGSPGNTTTQEAIDDMLSSAWDNNDAPGLQPAKNGGTAEFHPYPFVYKRVVGPLVSLGVPYRMTEANDCLHGVAGASNGYASALWALDYMHWWAAHHMAGANFHNNPWIPTDTIIPSPNPCPPTGCVDYHITAKGYGIKAFDLGGHGYVEPIAIANPRNINLTAYAVGTDQDLFVTILNKTHSSTYDVANASVLIHADGLRAGSASYMLLTNRNPGNAATMNASLGGALIPNNTRWTGKWTPLGILRNGEIKLTVPSTAAAVVRIHAAGAYAGPVQMDQDGALEIFAVQPNSQVAHRVQQPNNPQTQSAWTKLPGNFSAQGTPAVLRNEDNTLEVFVTGTDGRVYHNKQQTPGKDWSGWSPMGDEHVANLVSATNPDGSAVLFGIGANGNLWTNSEAAPEIGWSGWKDIGGSGIQPGFVVGHNPTGLLELIGVDTNGAIWHFRQTENYTWTHWSRRQEEVEPQLAMGQNLDGRLELFAISKNHLLLHSIQLIAGGEWSKWMDLGNTEITSPFAVAQDKDGRLIFFGFGSNALQTLSQRTPGSSYGASIDLPATGITPIALGNNKDGNIEIFGVDSNGAIESTTQSDAADQWTGWSK
jgi:hypothetical protein